MENGELLGIIYTCTYRCTMCIHVLKAHDPPGSPSIDYTATWTVRHDFVDSVLRRFRVQSLGNSTSLDSQKGP